MRRAQALHSVLGPNGPLLHSGVSVAPQPRHLVGALCLASGWGRLAGVVEPDVLALEFAAGGLTIWEGPCCPDIIDVPSEARRSKVSKSWPRDIGAD
jgi:hypothetical protein